MEGMRSNREAFAESPIEYLPYVERELGEGKGLLAALAKQACLVVTDEFPCFMLPRMVEAAAKSIPARLEVVDGNGIVPLAAVDRAFTTAHSYRRAFQKELHAFLDEAPAAEPLKGLKLPRAAPLAKAIRERWPLADDLLDAGRSALATLPIDHEVVAVEEIGGEDAARERLQAFMKQRFQGYADTRNLPDQNGSSGLSFPLHFGHISAHEIFAAIAKREAWTRGRLSSEVKGSREGWWGMKPDAEAFLDQLLTWRELGYHFCRRNPEDYDRFESLPDFAQKTLMEHASDERPAVYELEQFDRAATHVPLWNAAQRQLVREGRIHNYLRMLWGKKILEWSADPQEALRIMIELNNRYAVDGRNPNSYSGIFWVMGRFDRAWGPERPIFGKVRYMTAQNTARKVRVKDYLARYAA